MGGQVVETGAARGLGPDAGEGKLKFDRRAVDARFRHIAAQPDGAGDCDHAVVVARLVFQPEGTALGQARAVSAEL